jgi:heptosyltransferase-2
VKKILIIGPNWVGDMVMAQSLLMALKQKDPEVLIDLVVPKWVMAVAERMPEINQVIATDFKHGEFTFKKRLALAKSLRKANYTQAFILPNSWKSALIPFLAGIPKRCGWRGEWRYGLLNDLRKLDKTKLPLMVEKYVALSYPKDEYQSGMGYPLPHLHTNEVKGRESMAKLGLNLEKPILVFCPGAAYGPAKRWPARYFADLAKAKAAQGYQIWLFGSPNEKTITDEIDKLSGNLCHNLAGSTSLAEMVDLMGFAKAVISNDSGPMHIAAALQKPLIAIYGSSTAAYTPPLSKTAKIVALDNLPCRPCFERTCPLGHMKCLNELYPGIVAQALDDILREQV